MRAKKRIEAVALILLLGLFLPGLFPTESPAAAKTRVAVIDFEQKAFQEFQGKQIGEIVAEWLITSLANTGRFEVVERAQLQKVLKEQQLGISGMINQETGGNNPSCIVSHENQNKWCVFILIFDNAAGIFPIKYERAL